MNDLLTTEYLAGMDVARGVMVGGDGWAVVGPTLDAAVAAARDAVSFHAELDFRPTLEGQRRAWLDRIPTG